VGPRYLHHDILQTLPVSQQAETHFDAWIFGRMTVTLFIYFIYQLQLGLCPVAVFT
jgi:hypothetical protein